MGKYSNEITFAFDEKERKNNEQGKPMLNEFVDPEDSVTWMFEPSIGKIQIKND